MIIHGLQKMTLLDYPGKVACTVFLGGCDFRCPYCHNWDMACGKEPPLMEDDKLLEFLKSRKGLLDGVAITGGEPLLRPDLAKLLSSIKELGYSIKLDTNGSHPARLKEIVMAGPVDYVAMDIKNELSRYPLTIGVEDFNTDCIRESVDFLLEKRVEYEFRTTVVKQFHDREAFASIGELIDGAGRYFLQAFADRESVPFAGLEGYGRDKMEEFADIVRPFVGKVALRGLD
ncbi:MAG: anaerobic ribonucleoside-triphosphate reductase activating protein [Lachnospiraceae bacterium]|jgi:pyruvate formate lyase activating enzyme